MVKFYKFIMASILSIWALSANAINVTLNIDDPGRVKVTVNYVVRELTAGDNKFDVEQYNQIAIEAKEGALLRSVVRTSDGASEYINGMTSCSLYIYESNEGETWTVTSAAESDVRTASCTVTVDEASKVRVQRGGTYKTVSLTDGENTVWFTPGIETQLIIASVDYSTPLYKVTLDGEPLESQYGTWYVNLAQDAQIEITANYPDVPVPVHFVYEDEESKGFITGVTINGEPVENYNDADFTVKAGAALSVSGNTSDYKLDNFSVNGTPVSYFYSPYSLTVTDETTISVKAHKYATIKATLDIDNPENIIVYRGSSYNGTLMTGLESGKNEVELSETNCAISIKAESGCYITSVTDDAGNQYYADYNNSYSVTLTDGMTLTVISGRIKRDQQAVVYIDDRSAAAQYFSFTRNDRSEINVVSGYNTIEFYSGDNPMGLSWYGAPYANVILNGTMVKPLYDNSTTYQMEFEDGDVLKIFLASNPKTYGVSFDVQDGIDASVVCDMIKDMPEWKDGFSVLQDTRVDLTVAETQEEVSVLVNTEPVEAVDGKYTFSVNADTNVAISVSTGIRNVDTLASDNGNVYNTQGMKVLDGAGDMTGLPAGMYIVNGKKIVIRK